MTSSDRHASHDSPYRTGQHMPLNQSRHAPLTSIATSAVESRADLNSPYMEENPRISTSGLPNGHAGWPGTPGGGHLQSPTSPYSPGMRSNLASQRRDSSEHNSFESATAGEIQMQNFQEGLPPPPPVAHSWKRIDQWVENNYEELYDQLAEGCTQNDVNELEHELDCSLPLEVRESLQIHDGQERGGMPTGIIFGCMLLDCEEIVQEWKNWKVVNEEYLSNPIKPRNQLVNRPLGGAPSSSRAAAQGSAHPGWRQELLERQTSQPSRTVQKAYTHPGWIPLARDWGGNNIAVDLAPGPLGKWGQIIIFGRDYDCKYVIARSWAAFLAMVADDISSEKVYVDEETQELKLREFKAASVEPSYLDILRWRMDQKYGRKGPRRRPGNLNTQAHPGSQTGSPYGSPTEDRGRSPIRFSNRGAVSSSPRGGMGKPSPLAQVSEDGPTRKPLHMKSMLATEIPPAQSNGKLVEVETPIMSNDDPKKPTFELAMPAVPAAVLHDGRNKENQGKSAVSAGGGPGKSVLTGLGMDGIDGANGMKSVEI